MSEKYPTSKSGGGGTKLVLVAFMLAVLSVILINFYIEGVRSQAAEKTFTVYVLSKSVRAKDRIAKKDIRSIKLPDRFKEAFDELGAVDTADIQVRLADKEQFERSANNGEIITFSLFSAPGSKDIDTNIEIGKRQVSLPVNSRTAPGVLHEGMYVDIEAAFNVGAALTKQLTVMECVKIIAIGTRTIYDESSGNQNALRRYNTITIEVTPEQATQLAYVQRMMVGDFDLHLRNPKDQKLAKIEQGGISEDVLDLIESRLRTGREPNARNR